jgi:phosphoribosylglycinamide formyltransferase 1
VPPRRSARGQSPGRVSGRCNICTMQNPTSRAPIVVLISGRGSNLRTLAQAAATGHLDGHVAGVISNRSDAAGLAWAESQGLPTRVVNHRDFADRAAFDVALADAVQAMAGARSVAPWVVLAGFMRILGEAFTRRFEGRIVNIHPSLLPLYPGLHTHRQALADGALLHGATVHLVTARLDHGPILAQAIVPVLAADTEETLAERVLTMEHRLYPMALQWLVRGQVRVENGRALLDDRDAAGERVLRHPLLADPSPSGDDRAAWVIG